jgi:hypothetical protein
MMVDMAEAKRHLIWMQTAFFMGWACNACAWRDFIPRDIPTLASPSAEAQQAFKRHKCEISPNNHDQLSSHGDLSGTPF